MKAARSELAVTSAKSSLAGLHRRARDRFLWPRTVCSMKSRSSLASYTHIPARCTQVHSGGEGLTGSLLQSRVCSALWLCSQREREAPEKFSASCLTQTLSALDSIEQLDRGSVCGSSPMDSASCLPAIAVSVFIRYFSFNWQRTGFCRDPNSDFVWPWQTYHVLPQWSNGLHLTRTSASTVTNSIVNSETSANQIFLNPASHACERVSDDAGLTRKPRKQNPLRPADRLHAQAVSGRFNTALKTVREPAITSQRIPHRGGD